MNKMKKTLLIFAALCGTAAPAWTESLFISAAANLSGTLERLVEAFRAEHPGVTVVHRFGASGALTTQILNGAPCDVFLSADTKRPSDIAAAGRAGSTPRVYAVGVLVVASRFGVDPKGTLDFLSGSSYKSVALASPETVPYGLAAKQALTKSGLWAGLESRIVYGSSISRTVQFVVGGAADAGFINLSSALSLKDFAEKGINWVKVDPSLYAPIEQGMVLILPAGGGEMKRAAADFEAFLRGPKTRALFEAAGYGVPDSPGYDGLP